MRRVALAALALVLAAPPLAAQEGRAFNPIARPAARPDLPAGAVRISPARPIPREAIERAVAAVASAWNARRVGPLLGKEFPRAHELGDALQTRVPRDAVLRVTAIQGWQVLDQYVLDGETVSKVSVTVRTQVEFGSPSGYQVRDGTNEYLLSLAGRGAR